MKKSGKRTIRKPRALKAGSLMTKLKALFGGKKKSQPVSISGPTNIVKTKMLTLSPSVTNKPTSPSNIPEGSASYHIPKSYKARQARSSHLFQELNKTFSMPEGPEKKRLQDRIMRENELLTEATLAESRGGSGLRRRKR